MAKMGEAGAGIVKPVSPQDRTAKPGEAGAGTAEPVSPQDQMTKLVYRGHQTFNLWQAEVSGGTLTVKVCFVLAYVLC